MIPEECGGGGSRRRRRVECGGWEERVFACRWLVFVRIAEQDENERNDDGNSGLTVTGVFSVGVG